VGEAIERNTSPAERDSVWRSFLPALDRFRGPVTAIAGEEDFVDPGAALWRYAATRLPRLRLEVLPDAGHLPWIDQRSHSVRWCATLWREPSPADASERRIAPRAEAS